jgi:hypothetical protein
MTGPLAIDHLFLFVDPDGAAIRSLEQAGLVESYRRGHPGQGTANVCYCFDNAYVELLWVTDLGELNSPGTARTRLAQRADWRRNGSCPFGIALRGDSPLPFETWDYRPLYLPPGMAIPVALSSEDPRQPLMFRSPGNSRPDQWPDGSAADRQRGAGLAAITGMELAFPRAVRPSADLRAIESLGLLTIREGADAYAITLALSRTDGSPGHSLNLPELSLS